MVNLIPMEHAPQDGTEILAYHYLDSFHPVRLNVETGSYMMRWNKDYVQQVGHYQGWIKMPVVNNATKPGINSI